MPLERVRTLWLLVTVTVCGAAVMAVELLGARMLSVGYGGSMAVWAAMISVTVSHEARRRPPLPRARW